MSIAEAKQLWERKSFPSLKSVTKYCVKNPSFRKEMMPNMVRSPKTHHSLEENLTILWQTQQNLGHQANAEGVDSFNYDHTSKLTTAYKANAFMNYFLEKDLMDRLMFTNVDRIDMSLLKFPLDSALFILPKGVSSNGALKDEKTMGILYYRSFDVQPLSMMRDSITKDLDDTDQRYYNNEATIDFARLDQGSETYDSDYKKLVDKWSARFEEQVRIVPSITFGIIFDTCSVSTACYPIDQDLGTILHNNKSIYEDVVSPYDGMMPTNFDSKDKVVEVDSIQQHIRLAVATILYMSARSNEYDIESKIINQPFPREKKNLKGTQLLSPRILSLKTKNKYQSTISDPVSSGTKQIWHMRPGHFRQQRHGEALRKTKTIWIEPYEAGDPNLIK